MKHTAKEKTRVLVSTIIVRVGVGREVGLVFSAELLRDASTRQAVVRINFY